MALLTLCTYGHPLLKKKSSAVKHVSEIQGLIDDMFETLYENKGVGLAAVQVGKPLDCFVINASWEKEKNVKGDEEVFINPKILKLHGSTENLEEGCLSVPEIREKVKRKTLVDIEYTDRHGKRHTEVGVEGLRAHVIQHEVDHLNGILFVDRLPPTKKIFLKKELQKMIEEET
jgi:peptide deformylase